MCWTKPERKWLSHEVSSGDEGPVSKSTFDSQVYSIQTLYSKAQINIHLLLLDYLPIVLDYFGYAKEAITSTNAFLEIRVQSQVRGGGDIASLIKVLQKSKSNQTDKSLA